MDTYEKDLRAINQHVNSTKRSGPSGTATSCLEGRLSDLLTQASMVSKTAADLANNLCGSAPEESGLNSVRQQRFGLIGEMEDRADDISSALSIIGMHIERIRGRF